ncbi:hypothetical protein EDC61_11477 [Sulfuritortus calidifontis]|uniref:Uncharacterized protein n=1 Tax=Sulfuritortus calidifontis TaxID=1914471 RepID=A0A4R3JTK4_9PROT|nr:hypothetical protein [Sulfuritortus calidifontis]TCS70750.1 hypothetical protein EDC61_11477 [Sulfuritortus calidifontis]
MAEDWLSQAISVGLAKLAALQLPGTPIDAPSAAACRAVWVEAITDGRAWVRERDVPRIEAAFITLAKTAERWPAPAQFLRALPAVTHPVALPEPPMDEAQRAQVRELLRKAREALTR